MAKTRLNSADREVIADTIIGHKFDPLQKEAAAQEFALASQLYERLYSQDVRKKMRALPEGAFDGARSLTIAVNGQQHALHFGPYNGGYLKLGLGDPPTKLPVFASHNSYRPVLHLTDADELAAQVHANATHRADLSQDRADMRKKLLATLASFNTFDDLITKFPEAQDFIMRRWRDRPEGGSPSVPAVVIKDLARALDLPPELAEAA